MAINPLSHDVDPELTSEATPQLDPDDVTDVDPDSSDASDPEVDPLQPARTSDEPIPSGDADESRQS
jgi:hypothetical protein